MSITGFVAGCEGWPGSSASHGCGYFEQRAPIIVNCSEGLAPPMYRNAKRRIQVMQQGGEIIARMGSGLFSSPNSHFPRICCDETQDPGWASSLRFFPQGSVGSDSVNYAAEGWFHTAGLSRG